MTIYTTYAPIYRRAGMAWMGLQVWGGLSEWLHTQQFHPQTIADLGCGTGELARLLAGQGYHVQAIDTSLAMLAEAQSLSHQAIDWQHADLRTWKPAKPVDLAISMFDTFNYLLQLDDLTIACTNLAAMLRSGGYAAFDVNTLLEYQRWEERATITADEPDLYMYNLLDFHPSERQASGKIVWFRRLNEAWEHGEELHQQRAHTHAEISTALEHAGLELCACLNPDGTPADLATATRVVYVSRKP